MRLIELECPNCGAALKVNEELHRCSCNYCGHDFIIYDDSYNNNTVGKKIPAVIPEGISQEYINALMSAYSYINSCHLSKVKVYEQLISEDGEKFPTDAAQYAIDNLEVDWKEIALDSAKSYYYSRYLSMSKRGVFEMLTSEDGERFTTEEAQYAIDHLE